MIRHLNPRRRNIFLLLHTAKLYARILWQKKKNYFSSSAMGYGAMGTMLESLSRIHGLERRNFFFSLLLKGLGYFVVVLNSSHSQWDRRRRPLHNQPHLSWEDQPETGISFIISVESFKVLMKSQPCSRKKLWQQLRSSAIWK